MSRVAVGRNQTASGGFDIVMLSLSKYDDL
jgi:hypothetical protein